MLNEKVKKLQEEKKVIEGEVKKSVVGYILTALGLVAGLAWNDAIKAVIETFIKIPQNSAFAKVLYALVITAVVVIVSIYLTKLSKRNHEKDQK